LIFSAVLCDVHPIPDCNPIASNLLINRSSYERVATMMHM
jgi:hypothetical protein